MRQIFLAKHSLAVKQATQSLLNDYAVLVAVHYSCISSRTDMELFERVNKKSLLYNVPQKVRQVLDAVTGLKSQAMHTNEFSKRPQGYSCSGQVIAVGKQVRSLRAGDYVACVDVDLVEHTDIVCVPERHAVRVNDTTYVRESSLVGAGSLAMQGVREARVQLGESVCVVGLNLVGRIAIQLLQRSGCHVYAIDPRMRHMRTVDHVPGAEMVYRSLSEATEREIHLVTQGYGVDVTIVTGAINYEDAAKVLVRLTRREGKVVLVGETGPVVVPDTAHEKGVDFIVPCSYGPGRYDTHYEESGCDYPYAFVRWTEQRNMRMFINFLENKKLDTRSLIGLDVSVENIAQAYEAVDRATFAGAVVCYPQNSTLDKNTVLFSADIDTKQVELKYPQKFSLPSMDGIVRVAMVGAGDFAKTKLLPLLTCAKNVDVCAVVDANITNALNVARLYGIEKSLVDDVQLFEKDLVDAVIIASPHKFHCDQALRALQCGKAVFLEKPMVTDVAQLDRLMEFLKHNPSIPFCVDYSRSWSPFIQKIQQELIGRKTPLVIHYRVNAGFVPREHWMQTDVGAGRIIGEVCQIIDLFYTLVAAKPMSVSVESLHAEGDHLFPTDNFCAQISFDDGSLCSLTYTSLGHANLGRERMELFFDAKAITMDDYEYLAGFGLSNLFDETVTVPDKGHEALLTAFFQSLSNKKFIPPVSYEHLDLVARLTLLIDQLACQGGGAQNLNNGT